MTADHGPTGAVTFEVAGYGATCTVCGSVVLATGEERHLVWHRRLADALQLRRDGDR